MIYETKIIINGIAAVEHDDVCTVQRFRYWHGV